MSKNFPGRILATLLLYYAFLAPAMAEKTDVVVLVNGNAVTGEVKSLEFGVLRYSTDSMGTVSIDWEDIVSVSSQEHHQVELTDGTHPLLWRTFANSRSSRRAHRDRHRRVCI
jgi:hypothetical protein